MSRESSVRVRGAVVLVALVLGVIGGAGCGDDDAGCDPLAQTGCDGQQRCELVAGGEPACFAPLVVKGNVFDIATDVGIASARVVALDVNNAPASAVALSDMDGDYELAVPATRNADGTPVSLEITLRADAAGYATFPSGIRQSLPVDATTPTAVDGQLVIMSAQTDVGLDQLVGASTGSIHGTVDVNATHAGVLVEANGYTAVADVDGDYQIFNLPAATYTVRGYAKGYNYTVGMATLADGDDKEVNLLVDAAKPPASVTGSVQIVNPGMGQATSVILVVESTFHETLARGVAVPGLRAPDPGLAPDVSGAFTITGVPEGNYVVLAAFENDFLVRDPDPNISGTQIVHIQVTGSAEVMLSDSFKVTGSLDLISPGANGPELVTGTPTFSWIDDSSEDSYHLTVFDTFGNIIWEFDEPGHSGDDPAVPYGGPALIPGLYYQFRVASIKAGGPISLTEDLKGVFFVQ